jgi:ketosteroid isomerase-like protein
VGRSFADSVGAARAVEAFVVDSFFGSVSRFDDAAVARMLTPTFEQGQDARRLSAAEFVGVVRSLDPNVPLTYRPTDFRTQVRGTAAWTSYHYRFTFAPRDGAPTTYEDFETMVLVRGADGRWRIDRRYATALRTVW